MMKKFSGLIGLDFRIYYKAAVIEMICISEKIDSLISFGKMEKEKKKKKKRRKERKRNPKQTHSVEKGWFLNIHKYIHIGKSEFQLPPHPKHRN